MKNRLLALALVGAMALSMVACGSKEDDSDKTSDQAKADLLAQTTPIEYDVDEYVTLGQYKDLEVTLDGTYEYTEEGFKEYIQKNLENAAIYVEDNSQKEVKEDSIVNVDYVGSRDGVAFDGGSAEDQMIDVAGNCAAGGSGGYIEGFTAGLAGHSVGEEVAYEVTFPKEYGNADLAGQTVTFTFQINYIAKALSSKSELTDDIVKEKLGYDTVDDYVSAMKTQFEASLQSNLESDTQTAILNAVLNNSKVSKVPEKLLQARVDMYLQVYDKQYESYGTTAKEYLEAMGQDYDEYVKNLKKSISESTETELILEAIAKKEGLEIDEDGYKAFIGNVMSSSGATDENTFYQVYTVAGYTGERYFKQAYLTQKALDLCKESAKVNGAPATTENDEKTDAE
ncbi:trigger factor [Pseudobutyrivibrio sp. YE44]|uniref:FKBP-type peptidyl-prolyl cis-trans isomerase n=1 Tax=Pseudobutyrivibrio sp. YE44 TaxID=1520802 RepID=UPI0008839DED|nr:FKBP-type peptidyl-prolyl cis-trans isomerase [Pseudobutyrivibrio sp. YE44]SDB25684.1 trigger factor [Pseudobutyrivibrio sp. YE44]